ncbi:hypothetical protein PHLCEN_2v7856 [Hermanssonia centrifuga]|uniref:Uncharacterized protein n=1 Tax=Hermanssonia centrifuga TaxID=98765 RepID=A0A2R6NV66_9APHY|nr:hypothetical protein PHLCEN_2v7856 [Hermanssonia centrifuga]
MAKVCDGNAQQNWVGGSHGPQNWTHDHCNLSDRFLWVGLGCTQFVVVLRTTTRILQGVRTTRRAIFSY